MASVHRNWQMLPKISKRLTNSNCQAIGRNSGGMPVHASFLRDVRSTVSRHRQSKNFSFLRRSLFAACSAALSGSLLVLLFEREGEACLTLLADRECVWVKDGGWRAFGAELIEREAVRRARGLLGDVVKIGDEGCADCCRENAGKTGEVGPVPAFGLRENPETEGPAS